MQKVKNYVKHVLVIMLVLLIISCNPHRSEEIVNPSNSLKATVLVPIAEKSSTYISKYGQNQERLIQLQEKLSSSKFTQAHISEEEKTVQLQSKSSKSTTYLGDPWITQTGYASSWTGYKIPRASLIDNKLYSITIQAANSWVTVSYLNQSGQYISTKGGWTGVVSQNQIESNPYTFTKADIPTSSDLYIWMTPNMAGTYTLRGYQMVTGVIEGWATQTGYNRASTTVQKNVLNLANAANGKLSGLSVIDNQGRWLTDCADGDGAKMRSAIKVYHDWFRANVSNRCSPATASTTIRNNMVNAFAGSAYDATRRTALVNQIISRYNALACNSSVAVPTDDNGTLSLLAIQKQCIEWAETIGRSAGGQARGYSASGVSSAKDYRPGMALYKTDRSHAMLLMDIYWNKDGSVGKVRVAEANWASGWMNPLGAIPWERRVNTSREITSLAGMKVVSFE